MAQQSPSAVGHATDPAGPGFSWAAAAGGLRDVFGRRAWVKLFSWRAVLVAVAIVFLPIGGSLYLSYEAGLEQTQQRAANLAERIAVRARTILLNAEAAIADTAFDALQGCSEALIEEFRASTALNFAIRSMGYSTSGFVVPCTAWGVLEPPHRVPERPVFLQTPGGLVQFIVPTEAFPTPGYSIVMAHQLRDGNWLYVLIEPEVFIDPADFNVFFADVRIDLSVAGQWLAGWGNRQIGNDDVLGADASLGVFNGAVHVAVPRAVAVGDWRREVLASVAVGLAVSAALIVLLVVTLRRRVRQLQRAALAREIEAASQVQRSLLPPPPPPGFPIDAVNRPLGFVSGDFYDFYRREDGLIAFTLGDVAGKGLDAALLMSKTVALFRHLGKAERDPGTVLATMNDELCETASQGRFVTCVVGLFDERRGIVRFANAGHVPPLLLVPDIVPLSFEAERPPLGILPGLDFPSEEVMLDGGAFYVITDGLLECRDGDSREIGMEGVSEVLGRFCAAHACGQPDNVVAEVERRGWITRDDLTVLVISQATA